MSIYNFIIYEVFIVLCVVVRWLVEVQSWSLNLKRPGWDNAQLYGSAIAWVVSRPTGAL